MAFDIIGSAINDRYLDSADADEFAAKLMSEQPNSDNVSEEDSDSIALHLPLLVVAHGMDSDEFDPRDGHRLRMNLASAVKFLSSIGIYNVPTYGLYTEGTHSVVIVAWTTAESPGIVQIHDQNCVAYDIATWDGIVKLSKFLLWIRQEHAPYMLERFDAAKREEFLARLERGDPSVHWTAASQRLLEHSESDAPAEE
ncbi:hypothetical protein EXIGLDRAFT_744971 [Exidia glandulosa HHB12029]|uniref:Uncharacterized protein n=1 Tax=Exidia glandulosa HHB12029 TaxID=1314781 RepID=A0A165P4D4_EXIGL|nr:hypothetical protein EXIGLDRAFT_744971 [Exidia glandulosa HHB12029]